MHLLQIFVFTANAGRNLNHRLHGSLLLGSQLRSFGQQTTPVSNSQRKFPCQQYRGNLVSRCDRILFTGQGSVCRHGPTLRDSTHIPTTDAMKSLSPFWKSPCLRYSSPTGENLPSKILEPKFKSMTAHTQPALFALEYALFQLWQILGYRTRWSWVIVWEYVAACVAGVF